MTSKIYDTVESLYDKVRGDNDEFIDEVAFRIKVEELVDLGLIETNQMNDSVLYSAKAELQWSDFVHYDDCIKKNILLLLVDNPKTFFVLLNTQKGKMRINAMEIHKWAENKKSRVVAFIIVDNDTTLADQSADGITKTIGALKVEVFTFSSNSKSTFEFAKTYIDAYEHDDEYRMPCFIVLANNQQINKVVKLMHHICKKKKSRNSALTFGLIWDEADKTYPPFRNKPFMIDGELRSMQTYIIDDQIGLHRLGFTTASDGKLLDEEFPECSNAYLYPVEIGQDDHAHYRALHHPDSNLHIVPSAKTNNIYAMQIIADNDQHFKEKLVLPSGEESYRKTIVNSNARTQQMDEFARWRVEQNTYAMVFNGHNGTSIKVYRPEMPIKRFSTRGRKFNEVLFYIYKMLGLHDKPLFIIGCRKVDRGLGFHYCPRTNDENTIEGTEGVLVTRNEGLIWTDMILGKIDDKAKAVQKAGRLAGIIGNSPQYTGHIDYWTDDHTAHIIRRHNTIVDSANTYTGCSVLQAVKHSEDTTPTRMVNHTVDMDSFLVYNNVDTARAVCTRLGYKFKLPNSINGFMFTSINRKNSIAELNNAIKSVPNAYGCRPTAGASENLSERKNKYIKMKDSNILTERGKLGKLVSKVDDNNYNVVIDGEHLIRNKISFTPIAYRTFYPCYRNTTDPNTLHFVIIIRPDDKIHLNQIKEDYPQITIPQEEYI